MKLHLTLALALALLAGAEAGEGSFNCGKLSKRKCGKKKFVKKGCKWSEELAECTVNRNVWFVGNSFTKNAKVNMPKYFDELVADAQSKVATTVTTSGGYFLADHVNDGILDDVDSWRVNYADNVLVLQEQSQILQYSDRVSITLPAARRFKVQADGYKDVRIMLFETWGYNDGDPWVTGDSFEEMQGRITRGYQWLAEELEDDVSICPVGQVWARMMAYLKGEGINTMIMYRETDAKHASELGHYLVANALFACLVGESPAELTWYPSSIPAPLAETARTLAADVVLTG